jgi:hypothetical protein
MRRKRKGNNLNVKKEKLGTSLRMREERRL